MSNRNAKIYITTLSIITIIAIIFGLYINVFHKGGLFGMGGSKKTEDTITFTENISELDINMDACDLTVEYGNELSVSYVLPKALVPDIDLKDSTLKIKSRKGVNIGFLNPLNGTRSVSVVIPKDTPLKKVNINIDAGNIDIADLIADRAEIDVDAGNVEIKKATLGDLKVDTDAGNIDLNSCIIEDFDADVDAGNIEAKDCTINSGNVRTDIGNISLDGSITDVKAKSDVGNVEINGEDR